MRLVRVETFALTRFEVTKLAELMLAVRTPRVVTLPVAVLLLLTLSVVILEFVLVKLAMLPFTTPRLVMLPVVVLLV